MSEHALADLSDQEVLLVVSRLINVTALDPSKDDSAKAMSILLSYLVAQEAMRRGLPTSPKAAIRRCIDLLQQHVDVVALKKRNGK